MSRDGYEEAMDQVERLMSELHQATQANGLLTAINDNLTAEVARLREEAAEVRVVLRQFYGVDDPISSADIARKLLAEVARLTRERDALAKEVIRIADTMDTGTSALLDVQDALLATVAACQDGEPGREA